MPETQVRLSAGRTEMTREGQSLCFFAEQIYLLVINFLTPNPDVNEDMKMFELLGLKPQKPFIKNATRNC